MHSRDGEEYGFHGCFHEVRPTELIVQTFTFEGMPDGVALEKLRARGPRRRPHPAHRDVAGRLASRAATRFVASGMETGVSEGYERLDEVLAQLSRQQTHLAPSTPGDPSPRAIVAQQSARRGW